MIFLICEKEILGRLTLAKIIYRYVKLASVILLSGETSKSRRTLPPMSSVVQGPSPSSPTLTMVKKVGDPSLL